MSFSDLSEAEKQQDGKDLKELQVKTKKLISKARAAVKSLRAAADKLDEVWTNCKIAYAAGSSGKILGGCLTILGGLAIISTAGAAAPLLLAGMGFGVAGAGTRVVTDIVKAAIDSSELKKAEKVLKETLGSINEVRNTVQVWLDEKEERSLNLKFINSVLLQFQQTMVQFNYLTFSTTIVKEKVKIALESGLVGAQPVGKVSTLVAGRAGAGATGQASSQAAKGAGAQAVTQAGTRVAGSLIAAVGAVLLVWNAIDLRHTIKDIVQNKGSEVARCLRRKAKELESFILFSNKKLKED